MKRLTGLTILTVILIAATSIWVIHAQSSPPSYALNLYATYQYHNLKNPTALYMRSSDPGHLFIADTGNQQIKMLTVGGGITTIAGSGTAGYADGSTASAQFNNPAGIVGPGYVSAYDRVLQRQVSWIQLTVYDGTNKVVRNVCRPIVTGTIGCADAVTTRAGSTAGGFVDGNGTNARFGRLGSHGYLISQSQTQASYIPDPENNAIRTIDSSNNVITFAGTGTAGLTNGYRTDAQFNSPTRTALDSAGNLFVSDVGNFVVRKIDSSGNVSTFAGAASQQGYQDGSATVAQFGMATSLIYNPADGYVYVADHGNNCIRRIDSSGNVSTYAGNRTGGYIEGSLTQARFSLPSDIVINGNIMYVSDTGNNAIRRIDMSTGVVSTAVN